MTRAPVPTGLLVLLVACGSPDAPAGDTGSSGSSGSAQPSSATVSTGEPTAPTSADDSSGPTSAAATTASAETSAPPIDLGSSDTTGGLGSGCGNADAPPGETTRSLSIQSVDRSFVVDAPASIDPELPLALVFVFHGNGGSGQGIKGMGLQDVEGAQAQAVFVFPDGIDYMGYGLGWDGFCDEYDMEFFDAMVSTLADEYCIDLDRVFAAGFSWGGDMCQALACCRGDVVRAIAPASGPELFPGYPEGCPDTERPAFRMTYATNDAYPADMFAATLEWQRSEQGCSEQTSPIDPEPCVAYEDCDEAVIACEYEGLGHAWPGDWAEQTWAFFSQYE